MATPRFGFVFGMFVGAGLVLGGMILGAAARQETQPDVQDIIRAKAIEVVDELGTTVVTLGSSAHGGQLKLNNRFGKATSLITIQEHGGEIVLKDVDAQYSTFHVATNESGGQMNLYSADGKSIHEIAIEDERTILRLAHASGQRSVQISASEEEGGSIVTNGNNGAIATRIFSNVEGSGVIETYRSNGSPLVAMSSTIGDHGQVTTYAGIGKPLINLTATANHEGLVYVQDAEGKRLAAIATSDTGPTFRLFNSHDEPVVSLESDEEGNGMIGAYKRDGTGRSLSP